MYYKQRFIFQEILKNTSRQTFSDISIASEVDICTVQKRQTAAEQEPKTRIYAHPNYGFLSNKEYLATLVNRCDACIVHARVQVPSATATNKTFNASRTFNKTLLTP